MASKERIISLVKDNKSVALLAPTFNIDFPYPNIIGMLRRLGFDEVTELTYGARMVNWAYVQYVKSHPEQKIFISTPCPTVVAFTKALYPDLVKYLIPVMSPMTAMAKIYKQYHFNHKVVFISPCFAKATLEAPKYPELIDAVVTLKELKDIFDAERIKAEDFNREYYFDSFVREYTKIYPVSGGLASTSHISRLFNDGEILVTDGIDNIKKAYDNILAGTSKYRFLDLLNCDGGCIGGPAINNKNLPTEQKKEIIQKYVTRSSEKTMGKHHGKIGNAENIDISATYI